MVFAVVGALQWLSNGSRFAVFNDRIVDILMGSMRRCISMLFDCCCCCLSTAAFRWLDAFDRFGGSLGWPSLVLFDGSPVRGSRGWLEEP